MADPTTFRRFLGSTFVQRYREVVLTIGDVSITRYDMVHMLDCAASKHAATILSKALAELGVTTARAALALNPIDLASVDGCGITAIYVFLCWQRHARGRGFKVESDVTVSTLKTRVRKRQQRDAEPKPKRQRRRA